VLWGPDNRGAMLRVLGGAGDPATRIENRIGEPAANPYLYIASQIHAGLDGIACRLRPPPATRSPYADGAASMLPASLGEALDALAADAALVAAFGSQLIDCVQRAKRSELARHDQAEDREAWQRREYFSRF
jgi:glutamine synthetase